MTDARRADDQAAGRHTVTFHDVSLTILHGGKKLSVIENAHLSLPPRTLALIGESRLAAVAVMDLLCRRLVPQQGEIAFNGSVSWPIGHTGPFSVAVTGTQAMSHFATLYGFDRRHGIAFMKAEFADPGIMTRPMLVWPKMLQTQFAMLMALIPDFDIYIVDTNLIMAEDAAFSRRFLELFNLRRKGKTTLITARQTKVLQAMCDGALVVADRRLYLQDDLDAALGVSNKIVLKDEPEGDAEREDDDDGLLF